MMADWAILIDADKWALIMKEQTLSTYNDYIAHGLKKMEEIGADMNKIRIQHYARVDLKGAIQIYLEGPLL